MSSLFTHTLTQPSRVQATSQAVGDMYSGMTPIAPVQG